MSKLYDRLTELRVEAGGANNFAAIGTLAITVGEDRVPQSALAVIVVSQIQTEPPKYRVAALPETVDFRDRHRETLIVHATPQSIENMRGDSRLVDESTQTALETTLADAYFLPRLSSKEQLTPLRDHVSGMIRR